MGAALAYNSIGIAYYMLGVGLHSGDDVRAPRNLSMILYLSGTEVPQDPASKLITNLIVKTLRSNVSI